MKTSLSNGNISAIIQSKGAELVSLKKDKKEVMWNADPVFWAKHSPVLFPIVGTLKNNTFQYEGKNYLLSRHGFARDMEFEIEKSTNKSVIFVLKSSSETLKVYPFDFELRISYTFQKDDLVINYEVLNTGKSILPFSIGGHPAFALPGNFEDYSLEFDQSEKLTAYLLQNDLLSAAMQKIMLENKQLPLKYSLFEKDALVFKSLKSSIITILKNQNPILKISFGDFPNLGLWTKTGAPFICIEPWFGYSDTTSSNGNLLEKEGMQTVGSNESFQANFKISIV